MLRKLSLVAVAAASLGAGRVGPDLRLRLGRLARWLARRLASRLGLGRSALLRRRSGLLRYGYGYGGCYVRRLVPTPWGPRWRLVNRCY